MRGQQNLWGAGAGGGGGGVTVLRKVMGVMMLMIKPASAPIS